MTIYTGFTPDMFDHWVFEMSDKLEAFIASLYGDIKQRFDYSVSSLDAAEGWLIATYKVPEAIDGRKACGATRSENPVRLRRCARHAA